MISNILVPTDFSDKAENALRAAADLARKHNAQIYVLHMLDLPMHLVETPAGTQQSELPEALFFMKLAHQKFDNLLNEPFLKDLRVQEAVTFDSAFEHIMDYVDKYTADLIVMGSHGDSGIHELFIGSNAEKVVRNSEVPVLIIKKRHNPFTMDTFVYATDFKEENKNSFLRASKFASASDIPLHMLYVNTPNNFKTTHEIEDLMNHFMNEMAVTADYTLNIYNDTTIESGILHFAEANKAGIVGIGTHGRKGLAHFLNGSLSERLVNHANRPVITFKI